MSSILTNTSAITAVANLAATQKALSDTENQISTGLKVSSAKDNAAYYSIATTLRTQVGDLSAVSDSLNLGSSVVSTSTAAVNNVTSILQSIQKDLVSASQPGVDLTSLQTSISTLRAQLGNTIATASFNSVNLLDGSNASTVQFVGGVTGSGANTVVNTLNIDTTTTNLNGATYTLGSNSLVDGVITASTALTSAQATNTTAQANLTSANAANASAATALTSAITAASTADLQSTTSAAFVNLFGAGASISSGGVVTGIQAGSLASTLVGTDGTLTVGKAKSTPDTTLTYAAGVTGAGTLGALFGASATNTTASGTSTSIAGIAATDATAVTTATTAYNTALSATSGNAAASKIANGTLLSISQINVSSASPSQIAVYIKQVGAALASVNTASESLGAASTNIDLQTTYTSALSNSLTTGVGSLVDADLNEASTRLNALQTQQQLGVQALSVANQNAQLILKLFGG